MDAIGPGAASITVGVVGICSAEHLERCLAALRSQRGAPPFDVLVVHDPRIPGMEALARRHPDVRVVSHAGQRTPLELASRAVSESSGRLLILTEDHCVPRPDWVRRLARAQAHGRAAVGGAVDPPAGATAVDWAFYFVDFYRYAEPQHAGASPSLTVCNVAYPRAHLEAVAPVWRGRFFHETAVNDALRERSGELWLEPAARVTMHRHVRFRDALEERYAFGRLFGCTRLEFEGSARRLYYATLAPLLPVVLVARMAARALPRRRLRRPFLRALPALVSLVLAWSLGEWLGYLTRRRPDSLLVAQEVER